MEDIKNICNQNGIGIYGIISICIFMSFFTGMLVWAFAKEASEMKKMGGLPLDAQDENSNEKPNADPSL